MAKIKLTEGFSIVPEGTHVFKITKVTYDPDFGKMEIEMVTASSVKHVERFQLMKDNGEVNEKANNAFSYFAKTALNNFNLEEIDTDDLAGCYIRAEVTHDKVPSKNDPAKTVKFARLGDKSPASGFDTPVTSSDSSSTPTKKTSKPKVNLDDLLG